jgi:hypothetical protein
MYVEALFTPDQLLLLIFHGIIKKRRRKWNAKTSTAASVRAMNEK